jgi:hypothetical protein
VVLSAGPDLESDTTRYHRAVLYDMVKDLEQHTEDANPYSRETDEEVEESSAGANRNVDDLISLYKSVFGMPIGEDW